MWLRYLISVGVEQSIPFCIDGDKAIASKKDDGRTAPPTVGQLVIVVLLS
ncbi:hypothetical protein HATV-3_gp62 [Haloarcula tailed virus 3]|uniref:Uncharacterized protein n=1 Tax=Haloarcula tailed virus 3 TaxID=2877990 RepID=A0AAE8XZV8_9CAUD|nr:hypothetical protein M1M35_gp62 [Haloarcula tailed virus 3]UBF23412.1 hypothetical protein HATV-3_gp62 [Haloarcula tailed virus 3]